MTNKEIVCFSENFIPNPIGDVVVSNFCVTAIPFELVNIDVDKIA